MKFKHIFYFIVAILAVIGITLLITQIKNGCTSPKPIVAKPVTSTTPITNVTVTPRSIIDVVTNKPPKELRHIPKEIRKEGVTRIIKLYPKTSPTAISTVKSQMIESLTSSVTKSTQQTFTKEEVITLIEKTITTMHVNIPTDPIEITETKNGNVYNTNGTVASAVVINNPDHFGVCFDPKIYELFSPAYKYWTLPALGAEVVYLQFYNKEGNKVTACLTLDVLANWQSAGIGVSYKVWRNLSVGVGAIATYTLPINISPYVSVGLRF